MYNFNTNIKGYDRPMNSNWLNIPSVSVFYYFNESILKQVLKVKNHVGYFDGIPFRKEYKSFVKF